MAFQLSTLIIVQCVAFFVYLSGAKSDLWDVEPSLGPLEHGDCRFESC